MMDAVRDAFEWARKNPPNELRQVLKERAMTHPTHKTRPSDSSIYDEVCTLCGATDASGDKRLDAPCPKVSPAPTRCEPPPELLAVHGWHWIEMRGVHQMPVCWKYWRESDDWRWLGKGGSSVAPDSETAQGWRYLSPVYDPRHVATLQAWRDAIERWFVGWERLPDDSKDPFEQINAMVAWEQSVALDPAVSEAARALVFKDPRVEALVKAAREHMAAQKEAAELAMLWLEGAVSHFDPDNLTQGEQQSLSVLRRMRASGALSAALANFPETPNVR